MIFYLIGVLLVLIVGAILTWKDVKEQTEMDITISDIGIAFSLLVLSWLGLIFLIIFIVHEYADEKIIRIKFKKK